MKQHFVKVFIGDALEYKTLELLRIGHFFAEDQKATEVSRLIPPHPDPTPLGRAGPGDRIDLYPARRSSACNISPSRAGTSRKENFSEF